MALHKIVLAVSNPKGGTGKSTLAANISAVAASRGISTLLLDLDPQGSSRLLSSIEYVEDQRAAGMMFRDKATLPSQLAVACPWGYDVIAAGAGLIESEDWLATHPVGQHQLRLLFRRDLGLAKYDFIVIDTSGYKGRLLNAALLAATNVVIPIRPSVLSTNELPDFFSILASLDSLREGMGDAPLVNNGIVFNMVREGTSAALANIAEVHEALSIIGSPIHCASTMLPEATAVEEAALARSPVVAIRKQSKVAARYNELFTELFGVAGVAEAQVTASVQTS